MPRSTHKATFIVNKKQNRYSWLTKLFFVNIKITKTLPNKVDKRKTIFILTQTSVHITIIIRKPKMSNIHNKCSKWPFLFWVATYVPMTITYSQCHISWLNGNFCKQPKPHNSVATVPWCVHIKRFTFAIRSPCQCWNNCTFTRWRQSPHFLPLWQPM